MPYRRRYKRAYRRRRRRFPRYRRYGRRKRMRTTVRRMPMFFPDKLKVPLKSTRTVTPLNLSGSFQERLFGNSAWDPFGTTGTTQAGEFETWTQFYGTCLVYASTLKVRFINTGTEPMYIVCYPSTNSVVAASTALAALQKYARTCWINNASANVKGLKIYNHMSVQKLFGRRLYAEEFWHDLDSSPDYIAYWHLLGTATDGQVDNLRLEYTLIQYCVFAQYQVQEQADQPT